MSWRPSAPWWRKRNARRGAGRAAGEAGTAGSGIARMSVRNPVAVNLVMWVIIVGGIVSWFTLRREFFPNMEPDIVIVTVEYRGATPDEVEKSVARPVERELRDLDDVKEVATRVQEGVAIVTVTMEEDADRDRVLADVRSAMDKVKPDLPEGAEDPEIVESRPRIPAISVVVYGPAGESRLRGVAQQVRDELLDLPDVSAYTISGIRDREIWVEVLPDKLEEYGLTFGEVGLVLQRSNLDLPGGQIKSARGNVRVRTMGERESARDIEDILIRSGADGPTVRLRDIARVRETYEDRVERGRYRGEPAVMITVFKNPEQDAIKIADSVKEYVAEKVLPYGDQVKLATSTDLSRFIVQRLELMQRNATVGIILVVIVLAMFLALRVAFWVAMGLLISFIGTFIVMLAFGATINLISLFGLIVVLGLLVDDAIVIGEQVFAKVRRGVPPDEAAISGVSEVAGPVTVAVLTTIAAFLPLMFLGGRVGGILGVLPIVVIAALGMSLFEAFTILPAHLAHKSRGVSRNALVRTLSRWGEARHRFIERRMPEALARVLAVCFRWRYVTLAAVFGSTVLVFGLVAGGQVPLVLLQDNDAETVVLDLEMAAGTREADTVRVVAQLEELVAAAPEVRSVFSVVGTSFSDRGRQTPADPATVGQLTIELFGAEYRVERNLRTSPRLVDDLRKQTQTIAGVRRLAIDSRGGGPEGADIEVRLRADDFDTLRAAALDVRGELATYEGVNQISDDLSEGKLEIRFRLKEGARSLGLTTREVANQVRHALFGFEVQDLQSEDEEVTVRVLLPEKNRTRLQDLAALRLATPEGGRVPLEEAVTLHTTRGYGSLARVDGKRAITVQAEVDEDRANVTEILTDLQGYMERKLPAQFGGVSYTFEGRRKDARESISSLRYGFPLAMIAIYVLIAILFRSYTQPFIVMAAIPFSLMGAIIGHLVLGYELTVLSMIGCVALAGIVVNDSLILVDFINRYRRQGQPLDRAVLSASKSRLRPILLTTITTVAGLSPLLLEQSFQAQFLIPMAISIVFGIMFATGLTLIALPCAYLVLEDVQRLGRRTMRWIFTGHWLRQA